jgi:hypothetical protein
MHTTTLRRQITERWVEAKKITKKQALRWLYCKFKENIPRKNGYVPATKPHLPLKPI